MLLEEPEHILLIQHPATHIWKSVSLCVLKACDQWLCKRRVLHLSKAQIVMHPVRRYWKEQALTSDRIVSTSRSIRHPTTSIGHTWRAQKDTMKKVIDFIHSLIQVISKSYTRYSQTRGQVLYDDISSNKLKWFAFSF